MHWFWRATIAGVVAVGYGAVTAPLVPYVRDCLFYIAILFWQSLPQYHPILFLVGWGMPMLLVAIAAFGFVTNRVTDRACRCRKCGYILRGISEPRCPECGERI